MGLKRTAVLPWIFALAACATTSQHNADLAFLARAELVGMTRAQIVACAGKPESVDAAGDREALGYVASSGESTLMLGAGNTVLSNVRHSCKVTFVLRRGYVEDVEYSGARTGGTLTPDEECAAIVKKCTRPR